MILTRRVILREIKEGNISITPFWEDQVGAASVNFTLGRTFRVFTNRGEPFVLQEDSDVADVSMVKEVGGEGLLLKPGELVLGMTREELRLSTNIAGLIEGRSRFGRFGLSVHITAGFIQPGAENRQALEIKNDGPVPLVLTPGLRICQVIFFRCEGNARHNGRHQYQQKL